MTVLQSWQKRRALFSCWAILLVVLSPALVNADPVVVTGGSINLYFGDLGSFSLEGDEISVRAVGGFHGSPMVVEVVPGQPYSPVFDITVTGHGTATVPGFSTMPGGEFVDLGGQLHFVGETFTPMGAGALFTSYSFPFTMTGEVWAFARNQPGSERLFTVQVTGSGISEVGPFRRFEDDQQVRYLNLQGTQTITFTPQQVPEPVPEPATVLLLGSGLAACWRGVRKRVVDRSSP